MNTDILSAYRYCQEMADSHYENFPVASRLLPGHLRPAVSAIYAFARTADDYADEGSDDAVTRLANLAHYDKCITSITRGQNVEDPVFIALADVMKRYDIPAQLFHDLVSAFRQDVSKKRYHDFAEVLDYCRRSANPVGRLLLHLLGKATTENCAWSDNICSALQLINFYQDIVQDYQENSRIYLPLDEMISAGVDETMLAAQQNTPELRKFMLGQYLRAGNMLCSGLPLTRQLGLRMNLEIRATINGGLRVLEKLRDSDNIFSRPRLNKPDLFSIMLRTFLPSKACQSFVSSIQ